MSSNSIWNKNFILLCLANLTLFLSMQLLLPTLPFYILQIGGSQRDIGFIMGAYTLGAMLMRLIAGWLVDHYGRKINMVLGLVVMLAVTLLYGLYDKVNIILVIRVLHGMCFGLISTAIGTMVADVLPPARMGEGIGYFGLASTFSMALAPMVGLWLIGSFSYTVLFIAVSTLTAVTLFNSLLVKNTAVPISEEDDTVSGILSNIFEKASFLPSFVSFFIALIYGAIIYYIALYAATLGIANIGAFFAAISLSMIIVRPLSGRWADSDKSEVVILIGFITILISLLLISISTHYLGFLLAGAIFGIGFSCLLPTFQAMAVRQAPVHRRGAATGTYFMSFDMGLGLGAILWGYVAEISSFRLLYLFAIIPLFMGVGVYYRYRKRSALK